MRKLYLTAFLLLGGAVSPVSATALQNAKADSSPAPLDSTSCWDFTSEDREGRGLILMLHYGYVLGRHGTGKIVPDQVEPTLTRVALTCRDNPDLPLVEAFKQALSLSE